MTELLVMAARIVVLKSAATIIPATSQGGQANDITDGNERRWSNAGDDSWREYRTKNGDPIVVQKIASVTIGAKTFVLCIFWGRGQTKDAIDLALYSGIVAKLQGDGVIAATWPVAQDNIGNLLCTALEADGSNAATKAKAAWPATWRVPQVGDSPGAPSGPRLIGQVIE